MVTKATLDMKGMAEYLEAIAQAGKDIDAAAQRALTKGADILLEEMISLVPIDEGNLIQHVQIRGPFNDGNWNEIEVGVIHQLDYTDAETATYANVQEYGSPSKNIVAQPYIRPAIDHKKSAVMKAIRDSLKAEGLAD